MAGPVAFVDLMELEEMETRPDEACHRYMGKHIAFDPAGSSAYGGHVFALSVWAAAQTVGDGQVVHSAQSYFTLPAWMDRPLFYTVKVLSSGRSFCTRLVTVSQPLNASSGPYQSDQYDELGKVCFAGMCSFKKDEVATTKHQADSRFKQRFGAVLERNPEEHMHCPRVDAPWFRHLLKEYPNALLNDFPGLEMRQVDMTEYNSTKAPSDRRQLIYYRPIGHIPRESLNLHACAHLYASDRNSVFLVSNAVGFGDEIGAMGSLSHSAVLHVNSKDLVLDDGQWWCQEAWTSRSEGGRGMHESKIWDRNGVHMASTWQDGLARKAKNIEDQKQRHLLTRELLRKGVFSDDMVREIGRYYNYKL